MRLGVERRKRQSKRFRLIRPESDRRGQRDRCICDEISSDESPFPSVHKPRQMLEYKFRAIARARHVVCVLSAKSPTSGRRCPIAPASDSADVPRASVT